MSNHHSNLIGSVLAHRYSIRSKLKSGGFGAVYLARQVNNPGKQYAVKLMPTAFNKFAETEHRMYEQIGEHNYSHGFIKNYGNGEFGDHLFILMELIGSDLEELLCRMPHKTFSVKTALMVGLQVIDRLEALHRIGYLHRDVKPDNLAIGLAHNDNVIYLFDFGLALPILAEVPVEKKGKAIGTRAFMSCRAHQGLQLSPADDLESLIFTIFYLIEGTLPWLKGTADIHKVYTMKKHLNRNSFRNTSIPKELFEVLQYLRTLTPQRKLDYLKIKFAFLQGLKSIGEQNDFVFDWSSPTFEKPFSSLRKSLHLKGTNSLQSPTKVWKKAEETHRMVEKEIYEVYKFIQDSQPKHNKGCEQKDKASSPPKVAGTRPKQAKKNGLQRPMSAVKMHLQPSLEERLLHELKSLKLDNGPRIAINKRLASKI